MKTLRPVLGDQLSPSLVSLEGADPETDIILMMEVQDEADYVRHHKQKIALLFSAMRHFAADLREKGFKVDYVTIDDPENLGSFAGEVRRAVDRHRPDSIVVTEPGEFRVKAAMNQWENETGVPVTILEDARFLCSHQEFQSWAEGRKSLRMEFFYREMRRKAGWLMKGEEPEGGQWNYDAENRKALPEDVQIPSAKRFKPDSVTREVLELVEQHFAGHFGSLNGFGWGVTRKEALQALRFFIKHLLPGFGDYQDAMKQDEDFLFHSLLSPYLNCGLLLPREVCEAALKSYDKGAAPLAAVEGFLRQILGWREFIRGIYWARMPAYGQTNFLEARRPLPDFYWTGETDMNCMKQAVSATRRNAYAHHIQRLMVTGNFALISGVAPAEIEAWYLAVYADAYDWVELPNTHGMVMHADGGVLGSKPYAASGAYIDRMSNYCKGCAYSPKKKLGEGACPFNFLYWNFIMENEGKLGSNPRMGMTYRTLSKMAPERRKQIREESSAFLAGIGLGT